MPDGWTVEVTRTVNLVVPASTCQEARDMAMTVAWKWLPDEAQNGDQGTASVRVLRQGDLPAGGHE